MKTLIIGGTGLISTGIVKHLLARGAEVTVFNRGKSQSRLDASVRTIIGNRDEPGALQRVASETRFDAVIDMICFKPDQATMSIEAFADRCGHFIFCSTVCTYGIKSPPGVLINETFPQEPISGYGKNKVECERMFEAAHAAGKMPVTIIRPSHTYGPGHPLIDQLEFNSLAWDRIEKNKPVVCAGDGLGLWVSTHRDDCGKLFAYAAGKKATFGQSYNATRPEHTTWRDYYQLVAGVLGREPQLLFLPMDRIVHRDPGRFGLLREITGFHGAYDSSKARRDVPEFVCDIDLAAGAKQVFDDQRARNAWRDSDNDAVYEELVKLAREQ